MKMKVEVKNLPIRRKVVDGAKPINIRPGGISQAWVTLGDMKLGANMAFKNTCSHQNAIQHHAQPENGKSQKTVRELYFTSDYAHLRPRMSHW